MCEYRCARGWCTEIKIDSNVPNLMLSWNSGLATHVKKMYTSDFRSGNRIFWLRFLSNKLLFVTQFQFSSSLFYLYAVLCCVGARTTPFKCFKMLLLCVFFLACVSKTIMNKQGKDKQFWSKRHIQLSRLNLIKLAAIHFIFSI